MIPSCLCCGAPSSLLPDCSNCQPASGCCQCSKWCQVNMVTAFSWHHLLMLSSSWRSSLPLIHLAVPNHYSCLHTITAASNTHRCFWSSIVILILIKSWIIRAIIDTYLIVQSLGFEGMYDIRSRSRERCEKHLLNRLPVHLHYYAFTRKATALKISFRFPHPPKDISVFATTPTNHKL